VAQLKCLGTTLTNQNCILEEIKSRKNLQNSSYHSVHNLLSVSLLAKNMTTQMYRTMLLPVELGV